MRSGRNELVEIIIQKKNEFHGHEYNELLLSYPAT